MTTPTTPVNMYSRAKIYGMYSPNMPGKVYVGATCQALSARIGGHKRHRKRHAAGKFNYVTSFAMIDAGDCYIELIENYPCTSSEMLAKREGEIIREKGDSAINRCIAGRSMAEYYKDNRAELVARSAEYYTAHKTEQKSTTATCPHCQIITRKDTMRRHIRNKHPAATTAPIATILPSGDVMNVHTI